jgi:hypothetical protein
MISEWLVKKNDLKKICQNVIGKNMSKNDWENNKSEPSMDIANATGPWAVPNRSCREIGKVWN